MMSRNVPFQKSSNFCAFVPWHFCANYIDKASRYHSIIDQNQDFLQFCVNMIYRHTKEKHRVILCIKPLWDCQ